jgi:opacity protein-like surface antigen
MLSALFLSLSVNAQNKGYEKSVEIGYAVGVGKYNNDIFNFSMVNGYRFNNTLFAGIGVGVGYSNALNGVDISTFGSTTEYRTDAILIPIYANIKTNLSKDSKISPFLSLNVGYSIDANQNLKDAPGFYIKPNFGVDFKITDKTSIYGLFGFNLQHFEYSYTRNVGTTTSDWEITTKSEMFKAIDVKIGIKF